MNRHRIQSLLLVAFLCAVALALAFAAACGPSGFASSSDITSVRILATRADNDKAYAQPGDTVTLETLTVDGRTRPTPPAVTYWLPSNFSSGAFNAGGAGSGAADDGGAGEGGTASTSPIPLGAYLCENPVDDLYYVCFASLLGADGGTDAGAGGGGSPLAGLVAAGTDITPFLATGPLTFQVPLDIIAQHPVVSGTQPYGLIIVFNIACAGRVKTLPIVPSAGPQQIPIGCFDDAGNALDPDQYVIGFTRVYVQLGTTVLNPVISGFVWNGVEAFTADSGSAVPSPITLKSSACTQLGSGGSCPIDMDVPATSWIGQSKSIWVDYYVRGGSVSDDARLLYDITAGQVTDPKNPVKYSPPADGGAATIWAVVHDSKDGVTWLQINVAGE